MKTKKVVEDEIVVDARLMEKYPEPDPNVVAQANHTREQILGNRRTKLEADKVALVSMKERLAVTLAREAAKPELSSEGIKVAISEMEERIEADEAQLAEDSK